MRRERRRLRIEYVPIRVLKPDPFNPRRISSGEMDSLTRSIKDFGMVDPLVVRREDNVVIGGHQRLLAAKRLGHTHVPVVFVDLTQEQAKLLNLALNRISGEWDEELLGRLFEELKVANTDLSLSGFGEDEIGDFLKDLETRERRHRIETFDVGKALANAQRVVPRTKLGDLYLLGPHRLLCGDAASLKSVSRLMAGERADILFTDPPYGIDYVPRERPSAKGTRSQRRFDGILNDHQPHQIVEAAWKNILSASREGTAFYICAGGPIVPLLYRLFRQTCGRDPTIIVWGKESFSLSRRDYHPQLEFIFYGWKGKKHYWCGDRRQGDLWLESREPTSTYCHPTQKPLALVERALKNSSRKDDLVLDPFLGSGTTLVAAERLGRRCYAIELDPYYVDVAVSRWEAFTGEKARLEDKQHKP